MDRMIFHNAKNKISVGVELKGNEVWAALAVVHPKDEFRRKRAFQIVSGRLDALADNSRELPEMTRFLGMYRGDRPHVDVFKPIRDRVKEIPAKRREVRSILKLLELCIRK